jgi:hypothetical protein
MNKIALVIALSITQFGFSQVEKKVGDFNKVTTFDKIDVLLIPSKENKVILNGMDSNEVELVNKNGELKIRMPLTKLLKGDAISATVYYVKIDAVEANEGSRIASDAVLESLSFDIIAKEGSEIKLKLETQRLKIKVTNGSKIHLEGKAQNQDILINSGGIYKAEKLISSQIIITANAGGEATIFATDFVDAKVRAGGNIIIFGKPKQIDQKVIAGGSIQETKK